MRSTIFLLGLILLLGGCGSGEEEAATTEESTTGPEEPTTDASTELSTPIDPTPVEVDPFVALEKQVESADEEVRMGAASKLGEMPESGHERAAEILTPLLADESEEVRQIAASAYGNLRDVNIEPLRVRLKEEEEAVVKKYVMEAIYNIAGEDATQELLSIAADDFEEEFLRSFAIHALGQLKAMRARSYLEEATEDISAEIRRQAVKALGILGSEHSIDELGGRIEDNDPQVSVEAARALNGIGKRKCVEFLIKGLESNDWDVVVECDKALEKITKANQGFDESKGFAGNDAVIKKWQAWWAENKSFYQ